MLLFEVNAVVRACHINLFAAGAHAINRRSPPVFSAGTCIPFCDCSDCASSQSDPSSNTCTHTNVRVYMQDTNSCSG